MTEACSNKEEIQKAHTHKFISSPNQEEPSSLTGDLLVLDLFFSRRGSRLRRLGGGLAAYEH